MRARSVSPVRIGLPFFAPAVLLLAAASSALATPFFELISLTGGIQPGASARATSISNTGIVSGVLTTAQGETRAFTWANGQMTMLANPNGASQLYASSVNSNGTVAGFAMNQSQINPVLWSATGNGVSQQMIFSSIADAESGRDIFIGDVNVQNFQGQALSINDRNDTVGMWISQDGSGRAYCVVDGNFMDMGVLQGGSWAAAYGISENGIVIGTGENANGQMRAWKYVNGQMQELGTLGGSQSYAKAISGNGQIAGQAVTADGRLQAYRYSNNVMQGLGTLGGNHSSASGINNRGMVVGNSLTTNDQDSAFLYVDGQLYDLNRLVKNTIGWTLTAAYGINDLGQIVGEGMYQGERRAFLLNPLAATADLPSQVEEVPEPASLVSFGVGLGLIALGRIRSKQPVKEESQG